MIAPSRQSGFARNPSESQFPRAWQGIEAWWCPSIHPRGGNRLFDLGPKRCDGTLTNMANDDWVVSGDGGALDFDGTNDHIDYGTGLMSGSPTQISCCGWVYKTAATEAYFVTRYNTTVALGANRRADYFGIEPSGGTLYPASYFSVAGTPSSFQSFNTTALSITLNRWNFVGFSIDLAAGSGVICVNGRTVAATRTTGGTPPTALAANGTVPWRTQVYTGSAGTAFYFNGLLDSIRLFRGTQPQEMLRFFSRNRTIGLELAEGLVCGAEAGFNAAWLARQSTIIGGGVA